MTCPCTNLALPRGGVPKRVGTWFRCICRDCGSGVAIKTTRLKKGEVLQVVETDDPGILFLKPWRGGARDLSTS